MVRRARVAVQPAKAEPRVRCRTTSGMSSKYPKLTIQETDERVRKMEVECNRRERTNSLQEGSQLLAVPTATRVARAEEDWRLRPWYILTPHSRWMGAWDGVTAVALVYTAIVTPFEVGFLSAPKSAAEPLFIINRMVDLVFVFDMCLQFFLCYRVTTSASTFKEDFRWEYRLHKIATNYLRGWFFLDVLSIFPSAFDIMPVVQGTSSGSMSNMKVLRVVRALRLIKLVRLVRTSRMLGRCVRRDTRHSHTKPH